MNVPDPRLALGGADIEGGTGIVEDLRDHHRERLRDLPDLPTADEASLAGSRSVFGMATSVPGGTPPAVVQKRTGALQPRSGTRAGRPVQRHQHELVPQDKATPEPVGAMLTSEIEGWAPIIEAVGQHPIELLRPAAAGSRTGKMQQIQWFA